MQNHFAYSRYLPWLLLFVYFVLGIATQTSGHQWGDDWAQYVAHARNIVTGRPYYDTGYVFNPDAPEVGPANYPPGLPLLLAPAIALLGLNIAALKAVCFACVVAAFPVLFYVLSVSFGRTVAYVTTVLFALNPNIWALRDQITSEAPYLLFSMLTLWFGTRGVSHPATLWSLSRSGALVGLLTFATVACRSIGVSLFPALLIYGWAKRRPLIWFISLIGSFSLLLLLQSLLFTIPTAYEHEMRIPTPSIILAHLNGYFLALGKMTFPLPFKLSLISSVAIILLALSGVWGKLSHRDDGEPSPKGSQDYLAQAPLSIWYLAAYMTALVLATVDPDYYRYILPVLPLVMAPAVVAVNMMVGNLPRSQRLQFLVPVLVALAGFYFFWHYHLSETYENALCEECGEMYAFVRTHTAPDAVIAFRKPRAMALMTERSSWTWSEKYSPEQLRNKLRDAGATILVMVTPGSELDDSPASLDLAAPTRNSSRKVLFENSKFTVVQLAARP